MIGKQTLIIRYHTNLAIVSLYNIRCRGFLLAGVNSRETLNSAMILSQ